MSDWIRRLSAGPEFADSETTRSVHVTEVARLLTIILWIIFFAAGGSLLYLAFSPGLTPRSGSRTLLLAMTGGLLVGTRFLQWMANRGWVRVAATLFVVVLWGTLTLWLWLVSGISGTWLAFAYALVLVFTGMLLGGPGAIAVTALSIIGMIGAYTAERSGRLPMDASPISQTDLIGMTFVLILMAAVLVLGRRSLTKAIQVAIASAQESDRARRQLETVQASMEYRVAERTREFSASTKALQAVAEIGRAAAAAETVEALVADVAPLIADRFGCYHVGVYLLEEGEQNAVLRARGGKGSEGVPSLGYEVPMEDGSVIAEAVHDRAAKLAFGENVPRTAFALAQEALSRHAARLSETAVEVVLPLVVGQEAVGVVDMHISDLGAFYQQNLDPLKTMADQIAMGVAAAHRLEQSQSALQAERDYYGQISRDGWTDLLQSGVVPGYRYVDGDVIPVEDTWHPEMGVALATGSRVLTFTGDAFPPERTDDSVSSEASQHEADLAGTHHRSAGTHHRSAGTHHRSAGTHHRGVGSEQTGEPEMDPVADDDKRAVVAVPLRVRDQTIGVIHIRKGEEGGAWNARELELLESLTDQLESALESARLYRATQQAAIQQRTIAEVGSRIREEVDIESVLARALSELGDALAADQGAALLTLQDGGGTLHRGEEPV